MYARACGTTLIALLSAAKITTTGIRMIRNAVMSLLQRVDERGRALDCVNGHPSAFSDHLGLVIGPRRPHLAADPNRAIERVDLPDHRRALVIERVAAAAIPDMTAPPLRKWKQRHDRRERGSGEGQSLSQRPTTDGRDDRGRNCGEGHQPGGKPQGNQLGDAEQTGEEKPAQPVRHQTASVMNTSTNTGSSKEMFKVIAS